MKQLFVLISMVLILAGCSSTRWVVESQDQVDRNDFKLLDSELFLERVNGISPDNPILRFRLKSANTYEYAQRIKTDRYIQSYRPRLGYTLFGLSAAGLATYTALSDDIIKDPTSGQKIALYGSAALLSGVSFLNMKPVGEPTPTGESRLLRKTGTVVETDTLNAVAQNAGQLVYSVYFQDRELIEPTPRSFVDNEIVFNLVEELNPEYFPEEDSAVFTFNMAFEDSSYSYDIPVSSVFEQFVVVNSNLTALRNQPEQDPSNVLTDLASGSQLQLVSREGEWYKVLYGISENWVSANDVYTIWRPSQFAEELSVITVPNVPFGSVDVERDIPTAVLDMSNRWALIIANESYSGDLSEKNYAQRDGQLIFEYADKALGVPEEQILRYNNISDRQAFTNAFNRLSVAVANSDSTDLFVYLSGYAELNDSTQTVYLYGTDGSGDGNRINLNDFFRGLASLPLNSVSVVSDLIFLNPQSSSALQTLAAILTDQTGEGVIVFSSQTDQESYIYSQNSGAQKRHSIFTYFLADGIKKGNLDWTSLINYMERNISFTSRSIFNRPQDILFFGNTDRPILP